MREREAVWSSGAGSGGPPPRNGHGGQGVGGQGGSGGGEDWPDRTALEKYRVLMWVILVAVSTTFVTLTLAYAVRSGREGWSPITMPHVLWLSTAILITSSFSFEFARRSLRAGEVGLYRNWLLVSLLLGLSFLAAQLTAWRGLAAQGGFLSHNPHRSFVYLMTGAHAVHLSAGIIGMTYLFVRSRRTSEWVRKKAESVRQAGVVDSMGMYWHFMDALWIYIFALLFLWK